MPSKIKQFDFSECQYLRKILIDKAVDFKGNIDLTDTPIRTKTDIAKVAGKFKELPEGITALPYNLNNRVKLKTTTASKETQTDPVKIYPLGTLALNAHDKETLEIIQAVIDQ